MAIPINSSVLIFFFFFSICMSWGLVSPATSLKPEKSMDPSDEIWSVFTHWLARNPRPYADQNTINPAETMRRFSIFRDNLHYVRAHNEGERSSFKLGLNKFADLTNEEFKSMYLVGGLLQKSLNRSRNGSDDNGDSRNGDQLPFELPIDRVLPKSVDWRKKGAVAPPRDQGACGSCWAFSTVAAVEGINQIVTGDLVALSEQELVDCDTESNQGCNGGLMDDAFRFIVKNGGLETEAEYPYRASDGVCRTPNPSTASKLEVVTIDGFIDVPANNERALVYAVSQQPVSVAIEASGLDFQLYDSGVFTGACGTELDHGVTLVGYGSDVEEGLDYWILRNSWGDSWGEHGYILLERGTRKPEGKCGVNMMASFPVKLGPNPSSSASSSPAVEESLLLKKMPQDSSIIITMWRHTRRLLSTK